MRDLAWATVKTEQPLLLIRSPMCIAFSAWQHMNNSNLDPAVTSNEHARGLSHFRFCCEVYAYQAAQGHYFLHKHPAQVTSWDAAEVKRILDLEGVGRAFGHQCQYGTQREGQPIKKPTGFMSNS